MAEKDTIQTELAISDINEKSFFIDEECFNDKNFNTDLISLGIGFKTEPNKEKKSLEIIISYKFFCDDKDNQIEILKFHYSITYKFSNFDDIVKINGNAISIDDRLYITLVGAAISTGRGLLYFKTKNTKLSQLILPLIDTNELLNNSKKSPDKE